jgi:hypothetical protein
MRSTNKTTITASDAPRSDEHKARTRIESTANKGNEEPDALQAVVIENGTSQLPQE